MEHSDSGLATVGFSEKYAKRVIAAMLYTPSLDGNSFDYEVANKVAENFVSKVGFSEGGNACNWDYRVSATVSLSEDRELGNTRCTGLFDFEVDTFWGLSIVDGNPCVRFNGTRDDGVKINFNIQVE